MRNYYGGRSLEDMSEGLTQEEMGKARDAFYFGDIGNNTETGLKLLYNDENTINFIGKVLTTLVNDKID